MACTSIAPYQVRGLQSALHYNQSSIHSYTHSHTDSGKLHCSHAALGQNDRSGAAITGATGPSEVSFSHVIELSTGLCVCAVFSLTSSCRGQQAGATTQLKLTWANQ
ncbi:hypothetical protein ATANTOWER_014469 [Ataeniobius toweri]|uniref:Uncharacterized protein n=1 Tax=Ataeniobius toweri TaxID=208326 RepID=A0ABU7AVC6_9TELE|nr:hypothetical protein [Ataeniobius toweri]